MLFLFLLIHIAGVAELVDALGLGPSGSNPVEVQVLSPAQFQKTTLLFYQNEDHQHYYGKASILRIKPVFEVKV